MNGGRRASAKTSLYPPGPGPWAERGRKKDLPPSWGSRARSLLERGQRRQLRPGRGCGQESAGGREPRRAQSFPLGFPDFRARGGSRRRETLKAMVGGGQGRSKAMTAKHPAWGGG